MVIIILLLLLLLLLILLPSSPSSCTSKVLQVAVLYFENQILNANIMHRDALRETDGLTFG